MILIINHYNNIYDNDDDTDDDDNDDNAITMVINYLIS